MAMPALLPMTRMVWLVALAFLLSGLGCGTPEGTVFNVNATLQSSTCGNGAVDPDDTWSFQARLAKDDSTLTWSDVSTGSVSQGTIGDGTFSVSDSSSYQVTEATGVSAGCTVRRHSKYSGDVQFNSDEDIKKLDGTILFEYSQATGYDCDALIGATDGFDDLPCEVEFEFVATPE